MGTEDPDYQEGAHSKALAEGVLVAALKSTGYFFAIPTSQKVRCEIFIQRSHEIDKIDARVNITKSCEEASQVHEIFHHVKSRNVYILKTVIM